MKAVIMAGGEGSRLRPLTCDLPKPMARLCGRPILEYILDLISMHGITHAGITVRYLPGRISEYFHQNKYKDVSLAFVEEDKPLGTAGSVKNACTAADTEVLVISGDAMCDFDLTAAIAFHHEQGADVTIIAKKVDDPREYGLIDRNSDNSIGAFIEKPAFSQAVSDLANTGIYILSQSALKLIPTDTSYDFAKDLFPLMLKKGMKLVCWQGDGYWCDIGDLKSYIQCQKDMLQGKVNCTIYGTRDSAGNIFTGEYSLGGCKIIPPVYIGRGVTIEDGAVIEAGSIIDDGCYIGRSTRISGSVLLQNSYISHHAKLTGALICAGGTVKSGAMLFECATLGAGAVVGEKVTVHAGVKIWNKKIIPDGIILDDHVKNGNGGREFFDDEGISGEIGIELTPEFCARIGSAVGSLYPNTRIAVGCSEHTSAAVLKAALTAGIQSTGADVIDFGDNFQSQFEFAVNFCTLKLGIFIKGGHKGCIKLVCDGGLPAGREIERSVEGILSRGEFVRCSHDSMGERVEMYGMGILYSSQLLRCAPKGLYGQAAQLRSSCLSIQDTLRTTLHKLGCDTSSGFTLEVSSDGNKVRVYHPNIGHIPHHKILAWCGMRELEKGHDIAIPFDAPQYMEQYAASVGRVIHRYFNCPADSSDQEARKLAKRQMWSRDGLMQAVLFLDLLRKKGGLDGLAHAYPTFDMQVRTISTNTNPAGLIMAINTQKSSNITEGVLLRGDKGTVLVRPLKRGTGIKIMAEALNMEIANELCDDMQNMLENSKG